MSGAQRNAGKGLLARLIEARVIQTLAIYIPVGWVLAEITTTATPYFGLPDWVPGLAMVMLISGIPVVAFLSWAFQITPQGVRTEVASIKGGLAIALSLAVLLAVSTLLFQRFQNQQSLLERVAPASYGPVTTRPVAAVSVIDFDSPANDALGRVFASEIHDRLARHADLFVTAHQSPGADMLVDYQLLGAISEQGEAYRLAVELIGPGGSRSWSDEFTVGADLSSQQGLQRRISQRVAEQLGTRTVSAEYCEPSDQLEALESYHAARILLNRKGPENLAEAERLLRQAINLDPDGGRAYSALAITMLLKHQPGAQALAVDLSRKALDRCPTLGAAYKIWVPSYQGVNNRWIDQELQWRDALAMEPNHLWMLDNYQNHLMNLGMTDDLVRVGERAFRNNPMDPRAVVSHGWNLLLTMEFDQAGKLARRALELGDQSCNAEMLLLAVAIELRTSADDIRKAYGNVPARCRQAMLSGWENFEIEVLAGSRTDPAMRRQVLDFVEAGLEEDPNRALLWAIDLADPDLAHRALAHAMQTQQYIHMPLMWSRNDGGRQFRRDPRFIEFIEQMKWDEYWREFGWPSGGLCAPLGDGFICDR
jgi:tetratricopeptide (TPR) repeat protein